MWPASSTAIVGKIFDAVKKLTTGGGMGWHPCHPLWAVLHSRNVPAARGIDSRQRLMPEEVDMATLLPRPEPTYDPFRAGASFCGMVIGGDVEALERMRKRADIDAFPPRKGG